MFDAEIQKAVDDYLEMERKARVLDQLITLLERDRGNVVEVDTLLYLVHPVKAGPPLPAGVE